LTHVLVVTTLPDRDAAAALGRALVEARLAACISVGRPVQSIYHWRGAIETSTEVPLTIKTRAALFDAVAAAIRARHPYELPEVLAVPVCDGTTDYLAWIDAETRIP
jgi:periplasmic divalent cation tolerance protein